MRELTVKLVAPDELTDSELKRALAVLGCYLKCQPQKGHLHRAEVVRMPRKPARARTWPPRGPEVA